MGLTVLHVKRQYGESNFDGEKQFREDSVRIRIER